MKLPRVILDTNVIVSALRSRQGASFRLLSLVGKGLFELCVSVPLVVEYTASGKRAARAVGLRYEDIDTLVDYLCSVAAHLEIHFLWRPALSDPSDDMVLELAVAAEADAIVTFNLRDFQGCEAFGIRAVTPQAFLREIGAIP